MTIWTDEDEAAMARVMAGLRNAESVPGMEARVMQRMEQQRSSQAMGAHATREPGIAAPFFLSGLSRWSLQRAGLVAAGLVGLVLLGGGLAARKRLPRTPAAERQLARQPATPHATGAQAENMAQSSGKDKQRRSRFVPETSSPPVRTGIRWLAPSAHPPRAPAMPRGAGAVDFAGSFPAPPMPLTRQERLLLRMLAGGEQAELAATLSASAEHAMEVREIAQRQEFFVHPLPASEPANAKNTEESRTATHEADRDVPVQQDVPNQIETQTDQREKE